MANLQNLLTSKPDAETCYKPQLVNLKSFPLRELRRNKDVRLLKSRQCAVEQATRPVHTVTTCSLRLDQSGRPEGEPEAAARGRRVE